MPKRSHVHVCNVCNVHVAVCRHVSRVRVLVLVLVRLRLRLRLRPVRLRFASLRLRLASASACLCLRRAVACSCTRHVYALCMEWGPDLFSTPTVRRVQCSWSNFIVVVSIMNVFERF